VVDKVDFVKDNTKHENLVFDARLEARAEQFAVREERIALARQKRKEVEEELAKKSSEEKRAEHLEELKRAEAEVKIQRKWRLKTRLCLVREMNARICFAPRLRYFGFRV
jgi:hypothetical protein